jgi:hypothetical protein
LTSEAAAVESTTTFSSSSMSPLENLINIANKKIPKEEDNKTIKVVKTSSSSSSSSVSSVVDAVRPQGVKKKKMAGAARPSENPPLLHLSPQECRLVFS